MSLRDASAFIAAYHRHHRPTVGHKFSLGLSEGDSVVGVCVVGRPSARHEDDGWTLEVTRLATDGTKNACSQLYAAAWRATRALGYRRLITYILDSEPGTSLYAAGWRLVGRVKGQSWHRKSRPRVDKHPLDDKLKFEAVAPGPRD